MNVFIAGGSGTIGIPLVRALVASGHRVTALTRSAGKRDLLRSLGASVAIADALDREALTDAVAAARPTHVIHELTALPQDGVRRASDLDATNRLRTVGTRNLLDAAIVAGARRLVVGSFAIQSDRGTPMPALAAEAFRATRSMESQVLDASKRVAIEGVVLRYGLFYSRETPSSAAMVRMIRKRRLPVVRHDHSELPLIHLDDAVSATILALEKAPAGSAYDIVDDRAVSMTEVVETIAEYTGSAAPLRVPAWLPKLFAPYMAGVMSVQLPLSNARAKSELGWRLKFPTMKQGFAAMLQHAA